MGKKTPLYESHQAMGARLVDFAGWDMPIHYGSQIEEHHQVRQDAGMFDVSHMGQVVLRGADYATLAAALETLVPTRSSSTVPDMAKPLLPSSAERLKLVGKPAPVPNTT